nr:N-acetylmuramoyl-L-alanine amidase [uncultured bacterium]
MPANALLQKLANAYRGRNISHPQLRGVTLAQWMLESGRATSELATQHLNFGGLKWRSEMTPHATKVRYKAHDGEDDYCKFASVEAFIDGYWAFLARAPYKGWEERAGTPQEFIRFIGPIYTPSAGYADKVLALLAEAEGLLGGTADAAAGSPDAVGITNLGTIVIDPGHGGQKTVEGSSWNNATSFSGVKEKDLTLDFCRILRTELLAQAQKANEHVDVVMTRDSDVNPTGAERAGKAASSNAKLFLCLHFNGLDDKSVRGSETFYRAAENGNLNLQDDIAFARDVHSALIGAMQAIDAGAKDRGVKPDTKSGPGKLGVLNDGSLGNKAGAKMCRAAYIEVEFITHPEVDKLLVSGPNAFANRTTVMAAVARAIRHHMKAMP